MNGIGKREYEPSLNELVAWALHEDVASGDVTTAAVVPAEAIGRAVIRSRQAGVLSGTAAARATFLAVDARLEVNVLRADGARLSEHCEVLGVSGRLRGILTAERVALNFLQRLSGIATLTARYVAAVAGSGVQILDTRKTTPGLRFLEKEAVRHGGGQNHRFGLYDALMIKDNHSAAAGGLGEAIRRARRAVAAVADRPAGRLPLIVEAGTLDEVRAALAGGVDRILLDNLPPHEIPAAVELVRQAPEPRPEIEVSGGITLANVREYACPGVDYISVGALTHSALALDLALEILPAPASGRE